MLIPTRSNPVTVLFRMALVVICGLGIATSGGFAADSTYTKLDLDACAVLKTYEEGGGIDLLCDGYNGYPVFVSEGDLRFDVDFGIDNDVFDTFSPFNTIHHTIEWRVSGNVPHAAILRFFLDTGATGAASDKGEVLLVSKVGTAGAPGCPVAIVDTKTVEQANGVARGAAAMASKFECGSDAPVAIGADDGFAFSFIASVAEGAAQ